MSSGSMELPWRHLEGYFCFGCCADNPAGLALQMVREGDTLSAQLSFGRKHESYPGVVHGGLSATAMDELMGNALALIDRKICFTVSMRTRYLSPLSTGHPYLARVRVMERPAAEDGVYKLEGEILDAQGRPALMANATYQWMTDEQANAFLTFSPARQPQYREYFRRAR